MREFNAFEFYDLVVEFYAYMKNYYRKPPPSQIQERFENQTSKRNNTYRHPKDYSEVKKHLNTLIQAPIAPMGELNEELRTKIKTTAKQNLE